MTKILLAYDGSEPSKHAAGQAAELARRMGAVVTVLIVGEVAPSGYGAVSPVVDPEVYDRVLAEGVDIARARGVPVEGRVAWGRPPDTIVETAGKDGSDLIVVGHRGTGGLQSLLLGSVAKHVIDQAHCSVLVVR